ncbi:unnamed protein product [Rangifer tarandus platyrhynchus]|uniref:Uncharacterized protein n=1 Tax=Rangifer tarandus platyrhynchus TaxID=3082113 RepID=A0AC59Z6B3_RANTA
MATGGQSDECTAGPGTQWEQGPEAVMAATIITTVFITIAAIIIVSIVTMFVHSAQLDSTLPSRSGARALRIQRLLHRRL